MRIQSHSCCIETSTMQLENKSITGHKYAVVKSKELEPKFNCSNPRRASFQNWSPPGKHEGILRKHASGHSASQVLWTPWPKGAMLFCPSCCAAPRPPRTWHLEIFLSHGCEAADHRTFSLGSGLLRPHLSLVPRPPQASPTFLAQGLSQALLPSSSILGK